MLTGHSQLDEHLNLALRGDNFWQSYLERLSDNNNIASIHLAILVEPYLQFILDGKKTIESRFSVVRCAPYNAVKEGDVVLLKRSGGPIVGVCLVGDVWFFNLDTDSWRVIKDSFAKAICAQEPSFWEERAKATYATLMRVSQVRNIEPVNFAKRDRRGWVILQKDKSTQQLVMKLEGA